MRIIKSALVSSIFTFGVLASACASSGSQVYKEAMPDKKAKEFILMMPSSTAKSKYVGFNDDLDLGVGYASLPALQSQSIIDTCVPRAGGGGPKILGGVGAAIIGIFAKVFIQNAFETADANLAKKLAAYQSTYQAHQSLQPLTTPCVRFVRGTATASEFTPDFDIVLKLEPSQQHSMMQLQVLQIKTGKAKALGKVSYAVSAQFEGFYTDQNNIGQSIKYDAKVIHTGKYGADELPRPCLIEAQGDWDACAPVMAYPGLKEANSIANLTIKVTEVGEDKRKAKLEQWRKLLGQVKGDVSDTLSEAVTELLE